MNGDDGKVKTSVTDAGHGINGDPGACSGIGCANGKDPCKKEAELALKIETETSNALQALGVPNTRTRTTNSKSKMDQINYRVKIANESNADVLVSFHLDWEKGRKNITALYQQSEGSAKDKNFEENSKSLATLILSELNTIGDPKTNKVAPVSGNTRFKTLGLLNNFNGSAATLIEFGSVGDFKNVQLIEKNAKEIGEQIARAIYKFLYGMNPKDKDSGKENFKKDKQDNYEKDDLRKK